MTATDLVEVAPGFRTAVRDEGRGRAVLLLHGTPFDLHAWDPLVEALGGRCRTVRFDARGHGAAVTVPVGDQGRLAADAVAVLDRLDLPVAHVVGHSWGGQVAQQVALDHPDRVARLSLLCTRASPFPAFDAVARGLRDGTADPLASLARWFTPDELARPGGLAADVRERLRAADRTSWSAALELVAHFDVLDRLPEVTAPTDVVCAGLDGVGTPEHMALIADAVPHAAYHLLDGVRHLAPLQRPADVAGILERSG